MKEYRYEGLPLAMVRAIAKQVLQGVAYLHNECKIIHTDIKPENVLLTADPARIRELAEVCDLWLFVRVFGDRVALYTVFGEHATQRTHCRE